MSPRLLLTAEIFSKRIRASLFAVVLIYGSTMCYGVCKAEETMRPNILWITAEDLSPVLGCYGDTYAHTPNLDNFAKQSVQYTHAFATAPVCSPSRSCLITGCYATTLGTHPMRSAFPIPNAIRGFPELLRRIGYYTTNNEKTDYNMAKADELIQSAWDQCSSQTHWRSRANPEQPFFSVFNLMDSHQSRSMVWPTEKFTAEIQSQLGPDEIHRPQDAVLPAYYPDTPIIRREWARFYDCVTLIDKQVGSILKQLEEDGLSENTIVFFFGDHGSGMPRHKRVLFDSGMRVPLLIRIPERFRPENSSSAGVTSDRLVSFVDFAATVLSLASSGHTGVYAGCAISGRFYGATA